MTIHESTYNQILTNCSSRTVETGGIIGGKDGIITEFIFDKRPGSPSRYYPDVEKLNAAIDRWQQKGISFYGIVHTHLQNAPELSHGDKEYILTIMEAMPTYISHLYFPIVVPGKGLTSHKAVRVHNKINIISDDIKIIQKGEAYEK